MEDLQSARARGERVVLLCLAEQKFDSPHRFQLSVRPTSLPESHPLARLTGDEMGVVYSTDIMGQIALSSQQKDSTPTAAAMIRDLIDIYSSNKN